MRQTVFGAILFSTVALLSFFSVFAVHAHGPVQLEVKSFLETGAGDLPFSAAADAHMRDVYRVLAGMRIGAAALFLACIALLPHVRRTGILVAGTLLIMVPLVAAVLPWDVLFTGMHAVVFPQGNWQFPTGSLLIQTYPQEFFVTFAAAWGALCIASGLAALLVSRKMKALR